MASYEKRAAGWTVRFRKDGKQRRLSGFKTKKEAERAYHDATIGAKLAKNAKSDIAFMDLCLAYIKHKEPRVKNSTLAELHSISNNYFEPYFKDKKYSDITKAQFLQWQEWLESFNHSATTFNKIQTLLKAIARYANDVYDLPNRTNILANKATSKKELKIWSPEDFAAFIDKVEHPTYKAYFTFLYYSGCRSGEARALTFDKISENIVKINQSWSYKCGGLTTPKNQSSIRNIVMPDFVLDTLRAQEHSTGFVFSLNKGETPISETTTQRKFEEAIKAAAVPRIRQHDFRHSHASVLIANGMTIIEVAKRLGHSDIEQTLNTYSHLMPNSDDIMLATLNKLAR
jgi:integrase